MVVLCTLQGTHAATSCTSLHMPRKSFFVVIQCHLELAYTLWKSHSTWPPPPVTTHFSLSQWNTRTGIIPGTAFQFAVWGDNNIGSDWGNIFKLFFLIWSFRVLWLQSRTRALLEPTSPIPIQNRCSLYIKEHKGVLFEKGTFSSIFWVPQEMLLFLYRKVIMGNCKKWVKPT